MIITGGKVFILDSDILPKVTMSKVEIFIDLPESSTHEERTDYIRDRVADGSQITGCVFRSNEAWSKQRANEAIIRASVPEPSDSKPTKLAARWLFWKKYDVLK